MRILTADAEAEGRGAESRMSRLAADERGSTRIEPGSSGWSTEMAGHPEAAPAKQQGTIRGTTEAVLEVLDTRFTTIPPALVSAIDAMEDQPKLMRLLKEVLETAHHHSIDPERAVL